MSESTDKSASVEESGTFIVLDGIDGCGKSTQAAMLQQRLQARGFDVLLTREPGGTDIGRRIRDLLLDPETGDADALTEALLFCADRAEHVSTVIRPALQAGRIVVCDRFASATAVYQGFAGELGFDLTRRLNDMATGGTRPDLLIILDIDFDHALRRRTESGRAADRMERNSHEYFDRARRGFIEYAETEGDSAVVVDATGSADDVHSAIMTEVERVL
jgi:dTMP kinase